MTLKDTGSLGEKIAEEFLKKNRYRILDKNYSSKFVSGPQRGEIDIIARKGDVIVFVEVKTIVASPGSAGAGFFPEDKVNWQKKRKIVKTAEIWLTSNKIPLNSKWQVDVISVRIDPIAQKPEIHHFENISFN